MASSNDTGLAATMMDPVQRKIFPLPPTFSTKVEERDYLKFRLAQAFRIFGANIFVFKPIGLYSCFSRLLGIQ